MEGKPGGAKSTTKSPVLAADPAREALLALALEPSNSETYHTPL